MAKRVFFSFYYQDVIDFRANVVRQHWLMKPDREAAGFFDASIWGNAKLSGDVGIKRVINAGIDGTSATCVLVGSETYSRRWVRYEIMKSFRKGNALLSVHINSIKGRDQLTKPKGPNPLSYLGVTYSETGLTATLWQSVNGTWKEYTEIDGTASYQTGGVGPQYRGKGFNFAQWYSEYDWVANNGYQNFGSWVAADMPPNHRMERTAQQRRCARCWVPSSLRSSAAVQLSRSATNHGPRAVRPRLCQQPSSN